MFAAGIDAGTSGVKCTIFDEQLTALSHAYREYETIKPGIYEIDPSKVLNCTLEVISEAVTTCGINRIDAMCFTSFGESFVCLDENDKPLSKFMLYIDNRGKDSCEDLKNLIGEMSFYEKTGQFCDPMFSIFKLRSLKNNFPEIIEKTKKICFVADYLAYSMGAEHKCEYSLASRSGLFDIHNKCWWTEGIDFAGIKETSLPCTVPTGISVGTINKEIACYLGIDDNTKLILGGQDQICAAIGSGAFDLGDIANGMGTVDCMTLLVDDSIDKKMMLENKLTLVPYIKDGLYATYAVNYTGGSIIKWFRDTFAIDLCGCDNSYAILDKSVGSEPSTITVLPTFAKEDTPACIMGITLSTKRSEIYRAFLEGETFEMKMYLDILVKAGASPQRIITVGGGAKSHLWMQIRADILNKEILIPKRTEAGTLAAALICFKNLGIYNSIKDAQNAAIIYSKQYLPNSDVSKIYDASYSQYLKAYKFAKEVYND